MRIISGTWRGRTVKTPEGDATRPTYDRVREAVSSIIFSDRGTYEDMSILDAFAGSGALSFELLSRDAAHATLLDNNQVAINCIKENIRTLGVSQQRIVVLKADAFTVAKRSNVAGSPFDVVLLDPPYATSEEDVCRLLCDLEASQLLEDGALIVYEHEGIRRKKVQQKALSGLESQHYRHLAQHVYGKTLIDTFRWTAVPEPQQEDESQQEDITNE
ncbi:MAG: 16S rRNA (guanine(966)-N(2))-methyltransferase RsmD [Coriobacteriales bacterium]|nr:16S rRNA (guanine(966)-N(2))-methyltransferase RsmD [Coriobacteriales bacterium]